LSKGRRIRVLIADDNALLREGMAALVQDEPRFVCVGAVGSADDAIRTAARQHPDVALIDVRMPGGGAAAAAGIKLGSPHTNVIALSAHDDRATVVEMLEAGAVGYLVKGTSPDLIIDAIANAAIGKASLSAEVATEVIGELTSWLSAARQPGVRRSQLGARIERVLADESALSVVFQPIWDLKVGSCAGVEALARFSAFPKQGPDRWFADADEVGARTELELLAIRRALERFPDLPPPMHMAINVSPSTLLASAFSELIASAFPQRTVIELTEHAPVEDYNVLNASVGRIRQLGGRLSIDDAGAGFASLSHILRLAPDFIKLDKTLTAGIEGDHSQQALAAGLISFADRIGATIIAEGIEREEQVSVLSELGVPYGQGYHLGRPGPLSAELLTARNRLADRSCGG
jgi:EAL domain-containing protein (putative c-di-GMP-specific phosphodiesterase class I)/CheY-like chemotaxis protein